jgi:4-hydroxy-tetrahydrodipicolinate synthase
VVANQVPAAVSDMVEAALADDWKTAREIHYRLLPLMRANFIETNPIPVKTALEMMGHGPAHFRAPLCEMSTENRERLREALEQSGIHVSAADGRAPTAPLRAAR